MSTKALSDLMIAAKNRKSWGRFAASRFCAKRGIHPSLFRLACQLEAATKAGF